MRLTDQTVGDATCPAGRKDALYFDDGLKGFGVRVTGSGKRIFIFQYRAGPKVRRTVVGTFGPELTTAQARRKAEVLRGKVRESLDPVAEARAKKAAAADAEKSAKAKQVASAYTVDRLIGHWTEIHLAERSAAYRKSAPADMRRGLKPWLAIPAAAFVRTDAVQALDVHKIGSGPIAANRLRSAARSCWGWAVKRGALEENPWEATPRPSVETARERVLLDVEIGALWTGAAKLNPPWAGIIQLLMLTGQRRGEVAGLRWDELDFEAQEWRMPGSRTKNRHSHTVPLSTEALALLERTPRVDGEALVFGGPAKTPPSGFGKVKERLDPVVTEAASAAGRKVEPWTFHDIRRTVATGLQRLGVRLEVTEAVLNHVSGTRSGIVGVYQRHGWETEKAEALEGWAAHVLSCAGAGTGTARNKIVKLRGEAAA